MALERCHECGGEVSDKAASCPHCGSPGPFGEPVAAQAQPKQKSSKAPYVVGVLIAAGILGVYNHEQTQPFGSQTPTEGTVTIQDPSSTCWTALVGDASHDGCGDQVIPVHDPYGLFVSVVSKTTGDSSPITIQLEVNGTVIATNTTSAAYGTASVSRTRQP